MTRQNRKTRHTLIAWLLLALFMLPMVVKSVHVCQVETELSTGHQTSGQHSQSHNAGSCAICYGYPAGCGSCHLLRLSLPFRRYTLSASGG